MNQQDNRGPDFEERLLTQLRGVVAERAAEADADGASAKGARPAWRRAPRLALGGGVALAAVGAALLVSAGSDSTPAAFAVEAQEGGGVKIEIYDLGDPEGVEQALAEAGVRSQVSFLPAGMTCREPHYQPSMATLRTLAGGDQPQPQPWAGFDYESVRGPLTIAVGDYQQRRQMDEAIRDAVRQGEYSAADWPDFVIDPSGMRPDQTLVISSSPAGPDQRRAVPSEHDHVDTVGQVRVAEGEVGPCEPVPAGGGEAPVRPPVGGWDFSGIEYAGWGFGSGPGSPAAEPAARASGR
ncbi:MAG: hypothetical protein U0R71_03645 [Solirubrobacterales bacterium]